MGRAGAVVAGGALLGVRHELGLAGGAVLRRRRGDKGVRRHRRWTVSRAAQVGGLEVASRWGSALPSSARCAACARQGEKEEGEGRKEGKKKKEKKKKGRGKRKGEKREASARFAAAVGYARAAVFGRSAMRTRNEEKKEMGQ